MCLFQPKDSIRMARPRTFDTQAALIQARKVFWSKGFADTSIADLEQATGLNRTSLYAAFGDKRSLYLRILQDYRCESRDFAFSHLLSDASPRQRLHSLLSAAVINSCQQGRMGCLMQHAATEQFHSCVKTKALVCDNRNDMIMLFRKVLEQALTEGGLKQGVSPVTGASYIYTLFNGLMTDLRSGVEQAILLDSIEIGLNALFVDS